MAKFATVITLRNGRKLDARDYGYKAWPIKKNKKNKPRKNSK